MSGITKLNNFPIEYYSEMEKKSMNGQFTARIASFLDKTKINVRRSQVLGGMYCVRDDDGNPTGRGVDDVTEYQAQKIAHLDVCLVQKPEWFKLEGPDAIIDDEVIDKVFAEVMKFEHTFRGIKRPAAQANGQAQGSEGAGATQPAQADGGNRPQKVVDKQVQAALEP